MFVDYVVIIIGWVWLKENSNYFKKAIGCSIVIFLLIMLNFVFALFSLTVFFIIRMSL